MEENGSPYNDDAGKQESSVWFRVTDGKRIYESEETDSLYNIDVN